MAFIGRFIVSAASRLVSDPRVREKAADVLENEVKPRAAEAWQKARPKLEATRDELRDIARKTEAHKNPRAFAAEIKKRYIDRDRSG